MGWFFSDDTDNTKVLDTTGNVNNNIEITESVPIHNEPIIYLLSLIAILKVIEIFYLIFINFKKAQKKKYLKRGQNISNTKV